jgi:hypothetical protein
MNMKQIKLIVLLGTALVTVAAKPTQPNVTLMWDPSPDSDVFRYKVYSVQKEKGMTFAYNAGTNTSYTILLLPGEYTFFVTVCNIHGAESKPTEIMHYTATK